MDGSAHKIETTKKAYILKICPMSLKYESFAKNLTLTAYIISLEKWVKREKFSFKTRLTYK